MHDQSNPQQGRIEPLEQSVERMTTEIAALKLELATLHSALRELQHQSGRRPHVPHAPKQVEPPVRPTVIPAAIVVLSAAALLSWQLITAPRADHVPAGATQAGHAKSPKAVPVSIDAASNDATSNEPPLTPLVTPTVYRGTLSVRADHPGATVFVNRKNVGKAPVRVRNLRAGAHLVWVESDGYRRWSRVVTVPAERVTRVSADLEPIADNNH